MSTVRCVNQQGKIIGEIDLTRAPAVGEFIELTGPQGGPYIWEVLRVVHAPRGAERGEPEVRVQVQARGHIMPYELGRGGMEFES